MNNQIQLMETLYIPLSHTVCTLTEYRSSDGVMLTVYNKGDINHN